MGTLLNSSVIAKKSLMEFKNALGFTKGASRQYDSQFAKTGAKIGNVINIRKPQRWTVSDGAAVQLQDVNNVTVPLTLDKRKHVAFEFSTQELTLNIESFSEAYLQPAALALANQVDVDGLSNATQVYNAVGTPGTTPTSIDVALDAGQKLDEYACPVGNRSIIINPAAQNKIVAGGTSLFNPQAAISEQYLKGVMATAAGFDWRMGQNVGIQTVGALGGTPEVNGASQTGSSLATKGWSNSISGLLNVGDVFTIAGVNSVNPLTFQDTGSLQQFVVTATAASDGSGDATISISPSIVTSGSTQNVTASPADSAAITVLGAAATKSPMNLAYHKEAFILGCADLYIPKNVEMASVARDEESGLSIRFIRYYDGDMDRLISRLDILYGWLVAHPEWACRIQG